MSRTVGLWAAGMAMLSIGLTTGCPAARGPAAYLAGTWRLTESNGTPFAATADCAGINLVISADGEVTRFTECALAIDFATQTWVMQGTSTVRGVSSTASVADDGSATVSMVLEYQRNEGGVTSNEFVRMVFVGELSDDSRTLTVTSKIYRRMLETDPWTPQAGETAMVFQKQ